MLIPNETAFQEAYLSCKVAGEASQTDLARQALAKAMFESYRQAESFGSFCSLVERVILPAGDLEDGIRQSIMHLGVAHEIQQTAEDCGVLLTGSSAWGAFYALHAESDVDLLITGSGIGELEKTVQTLVGKSILDAGESRRFALYKALNEEGEADHFSIKGVYSGVNLSIDFMLDEHVLKISNLADLRPPVPGVGERIRTIREFRRNKPKPDGYTLDRLDGDSTLYHPLYRPVFDEGNVVGYLSDTLIDGIGKDTYSLGVISFFLAINPMVLSDNGILRMSINLLQSNIAKLNGHVLPEYITRQERMPTYSLQLAKTALSGLVEF